MPKLPVVVNESSYCRGEETFSYGSFARGAAFVVRVTKKGEIPEFCSEKRKFGKTNFEERVAALKNSALALKERKNSKSNEIILDGDDRIHKLIDDLKNDRWFELIIVGGDESKKEVKDFLASLKIDKKTNGIEIGDGALQILGDAPEQSFNNGSAAVAETDEKGKRESWQLPSSKSEKNDGSRNSTETQESESSSKKTAAESVRIVLKPRANYTDLARTNLTQGKVLLRVTFSANGGIGAISVIRGIGDGLTEQAIAASRRILFIPASRNGIAYSVTKPVEYTFTIF